MTYELVMGLEVHVELATQSKLFCGCSAKFGADPNENVCPACSGMPGLPPVANKKAIEFGIAASLVTNSQITRTITFDKKNYFYPDLSTGYQLTQLNAPICTNGYIDIEYGEANKKRITLKQIHIEEDAGKLVHDVRTDTSLVDYNRASVPLVEIVSNPDFRSAEEVIAYLEKLKSLLSFAGVSDCKMQEGSMRCDVNISVREKGTTTLGTRTEIKNMNSLKAISRAIAFEYQRHCEALENGTETLVQETRRWDDNQNESFAMRSKENATDYRYFPYPDVMPIFISDEWIKEVSDNLPEMAHEKFARMTGEFGLSEYDSKIITSSKNLSEIFDNCLKQFNKPKEVSNWIIGELLSVAKTDKTEDDIIIDCKGFAKIMELVDNKTINRVVGKKILIKLFEQSIDPEKYIAENQLGMIADTSIIEDVIKQILQENPKSVQEFKEGNQKVVGFFVGKIMRQTGGKADPVAVNDLLLKLLGNA